MLVKSLLYEKFHVINSNTNVVFTIFLSSDTTVWKSHQKHDHCFYGKMNTFYVKSTVLLKKLQKRWFHENFVKSNHSVAKSSKTRSPFLRENQHFFRQINVFTKEVTRVDFMGAFYSTFTPFWKGDTHIAIIFWHFFKHFLNFQNEQKTHICV